MDKMKLIDEVINAMQPELELRKLAQDQYKKNCAEWEEFQRQEAEKDKNKTIEQKETK